MQKVITFLHSPKQFLKFRFFPSPFAFLLIFKKKWQNKSVRFKYLLKSYVSSWHYRNAQLNFLGQNNNNLKRTTNISEPYNVPGHCAMEFMYEFGYKMKGLL